MNMKSSRTAAPLENTSLEKGALYPDKDKARLNKVSKVSKGELTRQTIIEAALTLASRTGLESITIGLVAEKTQMSKSGVFAHFGSREELQLAVCSRYHAHFRETVFLPALARPRGLPRLQAMMANWLDRVAEEVSQGCIYISGAVEYDDRTGDIHDALYGMVTTWQGALRRAVQQAIDEKQLFAEVSPEQFVYEMYSLVLGFHHDGRFLHNPGSRQRAATGFERLLACSRPSPSGQPSIPLMPSI